MSLKANFEFILISLFIAVFVPDVNAIRCYECSGGEQGGANLCGHYTGASCGYGFFGCVKIATFSGGVDKLGNFIDDDYRSIVSIFRGCNLLPFGGVDACQQQVILGMRVVTCYCYSDYCNSARRHYFLSPTNIIFTLISVLVARYFM